MGWSMSMSIGWPNNTSGSNPAPIVYPIAAYDCNNNYYFWSLSSSFYEPGAVLYEDEALTILVNGFYNGYSKGEDNEHIVDGMITAGIPVPCV